jgi:hypothetical protein
MKVIFGSFIFWGLLPLRAFWRLALQRALPLTRRLLL